MKKTIFSLCLFLCSCATNEKYFSYMDKDDPIQKPYKIYVRNVNVKLTEDRLASPNISGSKYPNAQQLTSIFKERIVEQLKVSGLYSETKNGPNTYECDFNINYVRAFMALTSDKYAGSRLQGYSILLFKGDKVIATRRDNRIYTTSYGLFGNLKMTAKMFSLTANENDEKKEVEYFAKAIANYLKKL